MRTILVTAITASFVTLLCVFGMRLLLEDAEHYDRPSELQNLEAKVNASLDSISALHMELQDVRQQLSLRTDVKDSSSVVAIEDSEYKVLSERLATVEDDLAALSIPRTISREQRKDAFERRVEEHAISPEVSSTLLYADAENYFESDSGRPLGGYTDSIDDALHAVEGIDLKGVDCRDTICKITYSKSESATSDEHYDVDSDLEDRLMFGIEGREVELRYANDSMGNNVIYAQVK